MATDIINPFVHIVSPSELADKESRLTSGFKIDNLENIGTVQTVDDDIREEMFGFLSTIRDPEYPHTLFQLGVISSERNIMVRRLEPGHRLLISIQFEPTVPHCGLATLIGLCIHTKVLRYYPNAKLDISIVPGTHQTEHQINRQINDKERVAAAMENPNLRGMIESLISEPNE